ncbi:hypothetical protein C5167_035477, partial [Papaver somniferum]
PKFCSHCGVIGHSFGECPHADYDRKKEEDSETDLIKMMGGGSDQHQDGGAGIQLQDGGADATEDQAVAFVDACIADATDADVIAEELEFAEFDKAQKEANAAELTVELEKARKLLRRRKDKRRETSEVTEASLNKDETAAKNLRQQQADAVTVRSMQEALENSNVILGKIADVSEFITPSKTTRRSAPSLQGQVGLKTKIRYNWGDIDRESNWVTDLELEDVNEEESVVPPTVLQSQIQDNSDKARRREHAERHEKVRRRCKLFLAKYTHHV